MVCLLSAVLVYDGCPHSIISTSFLLLTKVPLLEDQLYAHPNITGLHQLVGYLSLFSSQLNFSRAFK